MQNVFCIGFVSHLCKNETKRNDTLICQFVFLMKRNCDTLFNMQTDD